MLSTEGQLLLQPRRYPAGIVSSGSSAALLVLLPSQWITAPYLPNTVGSRVLCISLQMCL
jgi:hypothetical protein